MSGWAVDRKVQITPTTFSRDSPAPRERLSDVEDQFFCSPAVVELIRSATPRAAGFGRRDHALLLVAVQTGLRLSELTGLQRDDAVLGTGAHVRCVGKGRKERCTPLTKTTVGGLEGVAQ